MADARLRDVAERAGVSLTTASIVTRRQPGSRLSAQTRERVLRAAAEVGYRPRARNEAAPLVGLVFDQGLSRSAEGMLVSAVEQAWAKGCLLVVLPCDGCDEDRAGEARVPSALAGVIRVRADGPDLAAGGVRRTVVHAGPVAGQAEVVGEHLRTADDDGQEGAAALVATIGAAIDGILGSLVLDPQAASVAV